MLVTGGAGVMGRRLVRGLVTRRFRTRVLCLPADAASPELAALGAEVCPGDVTRPETLAAAVAGAEVVFHLAALVLSPLRPEAFEAVNAEGTRNLLRACAAARIRHFIHVSSVSVLYPWSNAYARSKRRAEEAVLAAPFPVTVVRPSLAYEDGGSAEFMRFVDHLKRWPVVPLPRGGRARKSPVHVDDLVAAFLALPGNPRALGKVYHLTGGDVLTLREMAAALLRHMGRPKPCVGFPLWLGLLLCAAARAAAAVTGRAGAVTVQSLTGLVQDAAPADPGPAADLGYRPRTFREGLESLVSLKGCLSR